MKCVNTCCSGRSIAHVNGSSYAAHGDHSGVIKYTATCAKVNARPRFFQGGFFEIGSAVQAQSWSGAVHFSVKDGTSS
ncbi:MAG: hypothetical protein JKY52_09505 [Flavobacteriales bacterium]|nr:hypothetical protein [Flavobacteriales bacterium]